MPDNEKWKVIPYATSTYPPKDENYSLRAILSGELFFPPCVVLWDREIIVSLGGWDETMSGQDGDLMLRSLAMGFKMVWVCALKWRVCDVFGCG